MGAGLSLPTPNRVKNIPRDLTLLQPLYRSPDRPPKRRPRGQRVPGGVEGVRSSIHERRVQTRKRAPQRVVPGLGVGGDKDELDPGGGGVAELVCFGGGSVSCVFTSPLVLLHTHTTHAHPYTTKSSAGYSTPR